MRQISLPGVNLDGSGKVDINTGISFLDHMLTSLATHSLIDIELKAVGDLRHHIAEDVALVQVSQDTSLRHSRRAKRTLHWRLQCFTMRVILFRWLNST